MKFHIGPFLNIEVETKTEREKKQIKIFFKLLLKAFFYSVVHLIYWWARRSFRFQFRSEWTLSFVYQFERFLIKKNRAVYFFWSSRQVTKKVTRNDRMFCATKDNDETHEDRAFDFSLATFLFHFILFHLIGFNWDFFKIDFQKFLASFNAFRHRISRICYALTSLFTLHSYYANSIFHSSIHLLTLRLRVEKLKLLIILITNSNDRKKNKS